MIDIEKAKRAVRRDVTRALQDQLPAGEGWSFDQAFPEWEDNPPRNSDDSAVVVSWTWEGTNEGLLDLAPTHRPVKVRGITVVTEGPPRPVEEQDPDEDFSELRCHRYVDWLAVLEEAGIMVYTRPIEEFDRRFRRRADLDPDDAAEVEAALAENPELEVALTELRDALGPDS